MVQLMQNACTKAHERKVLQNQINNSPLTVLQHECNQAETQELQMSQTAEL